MLHRMRILSCCVLTIVVCLAAVAGDSQLAADDQMVAELRKLPVEDLCRLGYEGAKANHGRYKSRRRLIGRQHGTRRDTTPRRKH